MAEKIFYNLETDIAYREDQSELANDNVPEFRYRDLKELQIQFLASDSVDGNGDFDDFSTALATASSASCAVDNDATHYDDGLPNAGIAAGVPIATIAVKSLTDTPRICGRLKLTNATAQTETINYNGYSLAGSVYTFTLADASYVVGAQTPTYAYLVTDDVRVLQIPIIKDAAVDCTGKATGLFSATLSADTLIFEDLIEGSYEIDNCKLEIQILDALAVRMLVKQIKVRCLYLLDDDGAIPPAPSYDYYTKTEVDALVGALANTQVTLTDDATTNITLGAVATYRAFGVTATIDDGTAYMILPEFFIYFVGATAYMQNPPAYLGSDIDALSWDADISGGNARLKATVTAHGANLKMVYSITRKIILST